MQTENPSGRFCTGCGAFNLRTHLYCDQCGLPLPQPHTAQPISVPPFGKVHAPDENQSGPLATSDSPAPKYLRWFAPGAALCCLLVAALASVIWHAGAPPPTHEEVLAAIRSAGGRISKPDPDLLCLRNLSYHKAHIQILSTDAATREWIEGLVLAGLYAPGEEVAPNEAVGSNVVQYQALPALKPWTRDGMLCVAQGWNVEAIRVSAVQKSLENDRKQYIASLTWTARTVAPWFPQLPRVDLRLVGVNVDSKSLTTTTAQTLERVNGRWSALER